MNVSKTKGFNRTFLVLKYRRAEAEDRTNPGFNRTFLVLK